MQDDRLDCDYGLLSWCYLLHPRGQLWGYYIALDIWDRNCSLDHDRRLAHRHCSIDHLSPRSNRGKSTLPSALPTTTYTCEFTTPSVFGLRDYARWSSHMYKYSSVNMLIDSLDNDLLYTSIVPISAGTYACFSIVECDQNT